MPKIIVETDEYLLRRRREKERKLREEISAGFRDDVRSLADAMRESRRIAKYRH